MSVEPVRRQTAAGYPYWIADARRGRWLVVTHGSFGAHEDFVALIEPLSARYNLLYWDLPGHGGASDFKPVTRLDEAVQILRAVMDAAGVREAHHLGFSFGGMIAQRFARRQPERTRALIAYACVPIHLIKAPPAWLVHALARIQFACTPWPRFCETFSTQVSIDAGQQLLFRDAMIAQSPRIRDAIYEAMIYGASDEPAFAFSMPVALLFGERDDRFAGAQPAMQQWASSLPQRLVKRIPNAGHLIHGEQPTLFLSALRELLDALEGP